MLRVALDSTATIAFYGPTRDADCQAASGQDSGPIQPNTWANGGIVCVLYPRQSAAQVVDPQTAVTYTAVTDTVPNGADGLQVCTLASHDPRLLVVDGAGWPWGFVLR